MTIIFKTWMRMVVVVTLFCALAAVASADPYKILELDIAREDEGTGKTIFTVHMLPGQTEKFDKIEYIVVYHQDFPFEDSRGNKYHKIHEPAKFKYTRRDIKLVEDLDNYVNFRVPTSRERLIILYGKFAFHSKYPITEPRIIIRAYDNGEVAWEHEISTDKAYVWDEKKGTLVVKPPKKKRSVANKN